MATLQAKVSRGHRYGYIVESRRVNGKPRPVVLAYLGKAEDLLRRLAGLHTGLCLKSYAHGAGWSKPWRKRPGNSSACRTRFRALTLPAAPKPNGKRGSPKP